MGKKRDVLFLCQFFHPEYITSAQLPYETVQALQAAGLTVGALCGYPKEYTDGDEIPLKENLNGIQIHRLRYLQLDRSGFLGRLVNYFSFTFMVLLHLGELAGYQAVVVYSNPPILPWVASWAKVLFGTKLVFVAYDLYPEVAIVTDTLRKGHPICRLMNHINRCVYRRADRVIALSTEMRDYILAKRVVHPERVAVIPNWYSGGEAPAVLRPENRFLPRTEGKFVVSYFGNMGTMQDMQTILDAIRCLKDDEDICFLFAGHGNKLENLRNIVAREGLERVYINGFLHGQDFDDALAVSSCALISLEKGAVGLCVPSKTYCYMMQGLPLLAIMDRSDIVRDIEAGAGLWVHNGSGEVLARTIRILRDRPEERQEMAKKSRELYLAHYTKDICTGQYAQLFRDLLRG